MEYISSNEFIKKLETKNYEIGSFDVYLEKSKELIEQNNDKIKKNIDDDLLKVMPTTYRASIIDKQNKENETNHEEEAKNSEIKVENYIKKVINQALNKSKLLQGDKRLLFYLRSGLL